MTARVQYAAILVYALNVDAQLLFQQVNLSVYGERRVLGQAFKMVFHLLKHPRPTECGTPNHHRINAVTVESLFGLLRRTNVAVADNGDMDTRVGLHFADITPVGLARVHLRARSAVYGKGCYATILQLFGQRGDDNFFAIPSQSRFHRYGRTHRTHHLACYLQHQGHISQHARTSPFACHFLHWATKVDVNHIGTALFHNACSLYHRLHIAPVDLYSHRAFLVADG